MAIEPKGLALRNPLLVRFTAATWQGAADDQPDPAFVKFKSAQFGLRAGVRALLNCQNSHGLNTVRGILEKWAPPGEADIFAPKVAEAVGVGANDPIDIDTVGFMLPMVRSLIPLLNDGQQPYSPAVLMEGLRMAGVSDTKPKPLFKSKQALTAAGSVIASGGAAVAALNDSVVAPVSRALSPYAEQNQHVGQAIGVLAGIGAALAAATVIFRAIQQKKTGL